MSAVPPRHLAPRRSGLGPRRRLLAVGAAVVVLAAGAVTIAVAVGAGGPARHGAPPGTSRAPGASRAPGTSGAPSASPAPPVRALPGNLLANGDFERGLSGWGALGGARLDRVALAHSGAWAARVRPARDGTAERPGIALPLDPRILQGRTYQGSAWVRASRPGTEATLALREYGGDGQPSADVIGVSLQDSQWHEVAVVHQAHLAGARLALELTGGDLGAGELLLVDDVSVTSP
jgi:hypothetical protein